MSIFAGIAARKLTNAPAVIFQSRWFIFRNRLLYYFELQLLQRLFKVGVLKTLCQTHRKITVLESLFNQPVSCYIFHERLRRVLVDIAKLSRTPFLQNSLILLSVFMEHVCNYNIIKFNVNYPKWHFEPFATKCIHVKLKLREREKLFFFFFSDSVKFVINRGYLFYNGGSYHI